MYNTCNDNRFAVCMHPKTGADNKYLPIGELAKNDLDELKIQICNALYKYNSKTDLVKAGLDYDMIAKISRDERNLFYGSDVHFIDNCVESDIDTFNEIGAGRYLIESDTEEQIAMLRAITA